MSDKDLLKLAHFGKRSLPVIRKTLMDLGFQGTLAANCLEQFEKPCDLHVISSLNPKIRQKGSGLFMQRRKQSFVINEGK